MDASTTANGQGKERRETGRDAEGIMMKMLEGKDGGGAIKRKRSREERRSGEPEQVTFWLQPSAWRCCGCFVFGSKLRRQKRVPVPRLKKLGGCGGVTDAEGARPDWEPL